MLHYVMSWEKRLHRVLLSYTRYLTQCKQISPWCTMIRWQPDAMHDVSLTQRPRCTPGRSRKRWDDDVKHFLQAKFESTSNWLHLACVYYGSLHNCEDEFIVWMLADTWSLLPSLIFLFPIFIHNRIAAFLFFQTTWSSLLLDQISRSLDVLYIVFYVFIFLHI